MRRTLPVLAAAALVAAPCAAHADGLPVGNVDVGEAGVVVPGDPDRIVTLRAKGSTVVARITREEGRVRATLQLPPGFTIPGVALDGTADGRSYDGRTAVLIRERRTFPQRTTRLVVLSVRPLKVRRRITLKGDFSFDALSPDGRRMYLVNYVLPEDPRGYVVRSYDLRRGRMEKGVIVDAREPGEQMRGYPVTRETTRDGRWAYTLYDGFGQKPFVHALNTENRKALCIDIPMLAGMDPYGLTLKLSPSGFTVNEGGRALASVDMSTFEVTRPHHHVARSRRPADAGGAGVDWWAAAFFAAFGLVVVGLATRGRRAASARSRR
jgi:hypothetical protein